MRELARRHAPEELKRLVDRDAPRVYSVLLRDRLGERSKARGLRRWFGDARLLFLSISEKLSPPRRLVFAASLIAALVALLQLNLTYEGASFEMSFEGSPLLFLISTAGLLFLLASELVDRVLVRDELEVARHLQEELLPRRPPALAGWAFASSWRTANDIGGDYHRFEPLADGRLAVVVADASGHGMAAGLLMAVTDTALRIAIEQDPRPAAVAELLHRVLRRTGDRRALVTLFYGLLDPADGGLEFVSAGHPSPLLRRRDAVLEEPAAGSLPLGTSDAGRPVLGRLRLERGDTLVISTDGVFEALGVAGDAFGWERLRRAVSAAPGAARTVHDRLRAALDAHSGGEPVSDDQTIVVVERL